MFLIYIPIIVFAFVLIYACFLHAEQRDKETRKAKGLPPKKYNDITDYDVTTVYTIHYK